MSGFGFEAGKFRVRIFWVRGARAGIIVPRKKKHCCLRGEPLDSGELDGGDACCGVAADRDPWARLLSLSGLGLSHLVFAVLLIG